MEYIEREESDGEYDEVRIFVIHSLYLKNVAFLFFVEMSCFSLVEKRKNSEVKVVVLLPLKRVKRKNQNAKKRMMKKMMKMATYQNISWM